MRARRVLSTLSGLALAAAGLIAVAPTASAEQVWYQGIERARYETPCPENTAEDNAAGWTEWTASWAAWANDETGGYVCTRTLGQAPQSWTYPSAGCVYAADRSYIDFGGGWNVRAGSPYYFDADCTEFEATTQWDVYAPAGAEQARALCIEAFGSARDLGGPIGDNVYRCLWT